MPQDLDPDDADAIRSHLGRLFEELRAAMLDVDSFPLVMFSDERSRVVQARTRAIQSLDQLTVAAPTRTSAIYARLPEHLQRRSVAESLLGAAMWVHFSDPLIAVFDSPKRDSRVFAAAPRLVPLIDESGLIRVTGLDARPSGLQEGDHLFQYHQLLRRGFASSMNSGLVSTVLRASDQYQLTARLALDDRRVQFIGEYREFLEADYWYGPSLDESGLDTLAVLGDTFYGDPNGGMGLLNPYAGLSVRWTADGNLKTVQIEEFMPPPNDASDWVFARYLHAIRDTSRKEFVHCDGAVKAYRANTYPRTQHDFRHRGKGDRYRKVFRVDGDFPVGVWAELACAWFRGNRLIEEYFEQSPS
ncbi:hypothetical protein [Demequina iriomotensis]|uniref:hypothetical protein n=1 Tax=Demequina iriomotensis TaxID=1536641 RepID=UPI000782E0DD|nr:hypothetical protein [Demequina iriomotensis]